MNDVQQVASHFGTTAENVCKDATTFFEMLSVFTGTQANTQTRKRWLRCLFCLGATPGSVLLQKVDSCFGCAFSKFADLSPQLRSLVCGLPNELSWHLRREPRWQPQRQEEKKWRQYANAAWCLRTKWLANVALSPWNNKLFIQNPVKTRSQTRQVAVCCARAGIWGREVVLTILYFLDLLKWPPRSQEGQ